MSAVPSLVCRRAQPGGPPSSSLETVPGEHLRSQSAESLPSPASFEVGDGLLERHGPDSRPYRFTALRSLARWWKLWRTA